MLSGTRVAVTRRSSTTTVQFYFRTTDVTGSIELPQDKEMVMPGDNVSITVKLIAPIAMEEGLRFAIREAAVAARSAPAWWPRSSSNR